MLRKGMIRCNKGYNLALGKLEKAILLQKPKLRPEGRAVYGPTSRQDIQF